MIAEFSLKVTMLCTVSAFVHRMALKVFHSFVKCVDTKLA